MIELELSEYCIILVVGALLMVALFGWISRFAHRNAERRGIRKRFHCDLCLHVWEEGQRAKIAHCPHCGKACDYRKI